MEHRMTQKGNNNFGQIESNVYEVAKKDAESSFKKYQPILRERIEKALKK